MKIVSFGPRGAEQPALLNPDGRVVPLISLLAELGMSPLSQRNSSAYLHSCNPFSNMPSRRQRPGSRKRRCVLVPRSRGRRK